MSRLNARWKLLNLKGSLIRVWIGQLGIIKKKAIKFGLPKNYHSVLIVLNPIYVRYRLWNVHLKQSFSENVYRLKNVDVNLVDIWSKIFCFSQFKSVISLHAYRVAVIEKIRIIRRYESTLFSSFFWWENLYS